MNKLTAGGIAMAMAITANAAELTAKENTIVATGTPREIAANKSSVTGRYITHLFNSHA